MLIGLVYNLRRNASEKEAEFDTPETIEAVKKALEIRGHKVIPFEADSPFLVGELLIKKPKIVFNMAEGRNGLYREAYVPAILEEYKIPYTHSSVLALAISMDKTMTKRILSCVRLPTPKFQIIDSLEQNIYPYMKDFPVIVKPLSEGSGMGVYSKSICYSLSETKEAIRKTLQKFRKPIFVEQFVEGREITVGIIGNNPPEVLPPMEIDFSSLSLREKIASRGIQTYKFKSKYSEKANYYLPARLKGSTLELIRKICLKAYMELGLNDIARFDLRVDKDDNPYILEVNPLPGLDPEHSDFPRIYKFLGKSFDDLINDILNAAIERIGLK